MIIAFNHGGACSCNAVYGWARRAYSSVPVERRASVVMRVIEYIASRLTASNVSDNKDYTQKLESWIRNPFMSECSQLLTVKELEPLNDALASHRLL